MFNSQNEQETEKKSGIEFGQTNSISTEALQQVQNEFEKKVEELRKFGIKFDDANYMSLKNNNKENSKNFREIVEAYYAYYEKMNMKIANFSKFNPEEQKIMDQAKQRLVRALDTVTNAKQTVTDLEAVPVGGMWNGIVNTLSGLKRKKAKAKEALQLAEFEKTSAENAVPAAEKEAANMRETRLQNMDPTEFIQELTELSENLRNQKVEDKEETKERLQKLEETVKKTKESIQKLAVDQESQRKKIGECENDIQQKQTQLETMSDSGAKEYIALETELDTLKTNLIKFRGVDNGISGELATLRTQQLELGTQQRQLLEQFNTLDMAIRILDAQVPYHQALIANHIRMMKNADIIETFSNQNQTNNYMDETAMKSIIESGLAAQVTTEKTMKEAKNHHNRVTDILKEGNKAFTQNSEKIQKSKEELDELNNGGSGGGEKSNQGNSGGGDYNPNEVK